MVDNISKMSLIRYIQKNISLMKIYDIILVLHTGIILLSSFVIYFFCIIMSLGKFFYYMYLKILNTMGKTVSYQFLTEQ